MQCAVWATTRDYLAALCHLRAVFADARSSRCSRTTKTPVRVAAEVFEFAGITPRRGGGLDQPA
jgi:hypothetical protein